LQQKYLLLLLLTSRSKLLLLIEAAKAFFNGLLNHLVNNAMVAAKEHEYMKVIESFQGIWYGYLQHNT
jgi:hypothetical protein